MQDLVIMARVFDLLEWLIPKGESFPRPFRATVTARLLGAALDTADSLIEAQGRAAGESGLGFGPIAILSTAGASMALAIGRAV